MRSYVWVSRLASSLSLSRTRVNVRMKPMTRSDQKTRITVRIKPQLSKFARQLLRECNRLKLPRSDACFVVAVSGGADSVALLLALDELVKAEKLRINLIVAHLDHR